MQMFHATSKSNILYPFLGLVLAISEAGTNSIVCTAVSYDSVRIAWMFDWTNLEEEEKIFYYVISWYTVEEIKFDDSDFRETVDYQYNSEAIR